MYTGKLLFLGPQGASFYVQDYSYYCWMYYVLFCTSYGQEKMDISFFIIKIDRHRE